MSSSLRRPPSSSSQPHQQQAEIALLPSLKSCLLNLPASLVSLLLNANTLAQNVVVELQFRQPSQPDSKTGAKTAGVTKSVFFGWTGMQSQTKLVGIVGRDGLRDARGVGSGDKEVPTVEIDSQVARVVGLGEGMKVGILNRWIRLSSLKG
nr:hypothetical protein CFP56_68129 [Quercus suber]